MISSMRLPYLTGCGHQRTSLGKLVDAIAGIPKFEKVWDWFNNAFPSVSTSFAVPRTRALSVRLTALPASLPSNLLDASFPTRR